MNGKLTDVIIEDEYDTDQRTGVRSLALRLIVWADPGMEESIKRIEGIHRVFNFPDSPTQYHIYLDPRYDREYLKREIEAVCKGAE